VRAFDRRHLMDISSLDVAGSVRELFESAVVMGRQALSALEIPEEEIARVEDEYRTRDTERLASQSKSGDLHSLKERMFTPDNPMEEPKPAGG
jgi:glutathione-regulated potassium-efflux system protein KefB